ncbi:MAG TPA: hypothetical protein VGR61_10685, partial [Candidatus Dormibacteraeota bacterium]|nr:hypothetical protein [Candidatus Dormibacteraeota bacterium]
MKAVQDAAQLGEVLGRRTVSRKISHQGLEPTRQVPYLLVRPTHSPCGVGASEPARHRRVELVVVFAFVVHQIVKNDPHLVQGSAGGRRRQRIYDVGHPSQALNRRGQAMVFGPEPLPELGGEGPDMRISAA